MVSPLVGVMKNQFQPKWRPKLVNKPSKFLLNELFKTTT
jgi:hypothetical protein